MRIAGVTDAAGLVVHGHLDVVPANPADWSVDPFSAVERDGMIRGRGAVDMKSMDAMMLANLRRIAREGIIPPRDLVFAFFSQTRNRAEYWCHWLVSHHPALFDGCTEAISEVGFDNSCQYIPQNKKRFKFFV